jgi:hypothetical protein
VGGEPEGRGRYRRNTMLYDVLVVSNGGGEKRFTAERGAPLSVGDIFEQEADSYRVLAIQPGHGPFDGVVEAEWPRLAVQPLEFVTQLPTQVHDPRRFRRQPAPLDLQKTARWRAQSAFRKVPEKPVLQALEDLSKKLLLAKPD